MPAKVCRGGKCQGRRHYNSTLLFHSEIPLKNASTNAQKSDLEKAGERNAAAIAWLKEEVDPSVLDPKHRWQAK